MKPVRVSKPLPAARTEGGPNLTDDLIDICMGLRDLIALAEAAMRDANRDGGEYDIEAELAPARDLLRLLAAGRMHGLPPKTREETA